MADAPFADVAYLQSVWRTLTTEEQAQAEIHLVVASAIIRARFPDIDARIEAGQVPAVLAQHVAAQMVRRFMEARTPQDTIEEQAGPIRERWSEAGDGPALALDDDLAGLLAPAGGGRRAPRTIALGLGICPP